MKAVILAAGIASRLRPLTDTTPKCLLKIGERCLLERAFDALIQNGFDEFIIVTGYRQQQIVDFLQTRYPERKVTFIYNDRYESTNNIYSLWLTRPYADEEEVLLLDSDIVFDPQIVAKLLGSDKADALALNRHELGRDKGYRGRRTESCRNQQGLLYPRSNRRIYRNREDVGNIHQGIISGVRDNDYSGRVG